MSDRGDDAQKGAQSHPEGGHGDKTRERLRDELESGVGDREPEAAAPSRRPGKHRLHEGREQHDEADLNSEKNRLAREGEGPNASRRR